MNGDKIFYVVAAGVLLWLVVRKTSANGYARSDQVSANGLGPAQRPRDLTSAIGGFAGSAACSAGGAALGVPQLGIAVAPLCGALGSQLAPALSAGGKFIGKEIGKGSVFVAKEAYAGASFVGSKTVAGLKLAGNTVIGAVENPIGFSAGALETSVGIGASVVHHTTSIVDRAASAGYAALPLPLKVATAPVYVAEKIVTKTADVAVDVGKKAVGAVTGAAKKVSHFLGF